LKYSKEDDMAIDDWVRRHVETTWHCLGTCSMAPREGNEIVKHGVLDPRLNVHGTKNLKVADLSICPGKKSRTYGSWSLGANHF
jgi:alcohol oxidase